MQLTMFARFCILFGIVITFTYSTETKPKVNVKNGALEGTAMTSSKGRPFFAFRGIPYAEPPVGDLRFQDPVPANSWEGVRSAENDSNICLQKIDGIDQIFGNEDCLYLNVFTPKLPTNGSSDALPVMIWIHGGGYQMGDSRTETYGPKYLLNHDVVMVSMNYRLAIFGFLSTEDMVSPGNYGLKDQALAIKWVHENIANFNGDPTKVTLFGESAGAASVHFHLMSPLIRGLFHRAISESGNGYGRWATDNSGRALKKAKKLGTSLNCTFSNSEELIACLKTKDAVDLTTATEKFFRVIGVHPYLVFPPVVEPKYSGAYLSESPRELVKRNEVADVPWMTGINSQEGALFSAHSLGIQNRSDDQVLDENFSQYAPLVFLYRDFSSKENHDKISKILRQFYFGDKPINDLTRGNLTDLITDSWFLSNHDEALCDHFNHTSSPIYNYYFTYRGSVSFSAIFGDPKIDYGVCHGDEMQYILDVRKELFGDAPMNEEELKMVDLMTTLWVNFARTGNPTPEVTPIIPVKWEPINTSALEYLHIGNPTDIQMNSDLLPERVNLWRQIAASFLDQ